VAKARIKNPLKSILGLNEKLAAIGVMLSAESLSTREIESVDIEETLADVAVALGRAQVNANLRLFAPVLSWIEEHGSAVIVEKLTKIILRRREDGADVQCAALFGKFALSKGHKRWSAIVEKIAPKSGSPEVFGPTDLAESLLILRGEEDWARGSGFRVPKGSAVTHSKWTLSRAVLAKRNRQYRNRLIYGAQWRADIVTAYELGARTPAEASRMSGASYEPCYRVKAELDAAGVEFAVG